MSPELAAAVAADDVVAAVAVLRDPGLPGEPWSVADIAAALPVLAEGPGTLEVAAWGARHLAAADEAARAGNG